MVIEREPAKAPAQPTCTNNIQRPQQAAGSPEFGKTTPLRNSLVSTIFNIPKLHKARADHHRSGPPQPPSEIRRKENHRELVGPSIPSKSAELKQTITIEDDNDDVVEIRKPTNPAPWTNHIAPPASYSSFTQSNRYAASTSIQRSGYGGMVGLTDTALFADRFADYGPLDHVDSEKATENIKKLLEGVFEDDEDPKPRMRKRKVALEKDAQALLDRLGDLSITTKTEDEKEELDQSEEEEEDDDGSVEGLKVKLLPHQVDGVQWMVSKETSSKKKNGVLPKGGILADDMGLGKTIQSIALLLSNPRPSISAQDEKSKISNQVGKSTLVVAPLALIKQWEAEIANRVESSHRMRVLVHHGPQRTKRAEDLRKYDVVVTTYQTIVSEHANSSPKEDDPQFACFGVHWYRVILDEAHSIKNRNAKSTKACYALRAEYRWCLTGTPMQNNLDELQSLIKFLRVKPYDDLAVWRDQITRPMSNGRGGIAMKRLQIFLKAFMKRRTKDVLKKEGALNPSGKPSTAGKPSSEFKITERKIENVVAQLSEQERDFYNRLERRADNSLKRMMSGNTINYASALVLLLRLRQACNHPELVGGAMAKDKDALTTESAPKKQKFGEDVGDVIALLGGLTVQAKECDICKSELTPKETSRGSIRCTECETDLAGQHIKRKKKGKKDKKKKKHYKKGLMKQENVAVNVRSNRRIVTDSDDEDEQGGEWLVSKNKQGPTTLGKVGGSDDENAEGVGEWLNSSDSDTEDNKDSFQLPHSHKKKTVNYNSSSEDGESSSSDDGEDTFYSSADDYDDEDFSSITPSTKITHLLQILHAESPTHKFIVFSQFTSMLDLIEPFLRRDGLVFTRYDGTMRNDLREASLDRLRNEKRTRILLCSLKCGSLGLNLTAASRVVILEPFWNPFVEEQAIDRVHRLNQTVDVIVYKLTIQNSVEERILDLQEKKRALASQAIEGKAAAKLSLKDILALFKRDAEHDPKHQDREDYSGKARVLLPTGGSVSASASGSGGTKSPQKKSAVPPAVTLAREAQRGAQMGRGGKVPLREDSIYGRRW